MARRCSICAHPERAAIDRELLDGSTPVRELAERLGVSAASIYRHRRSHPAKAASEGGPAAPSLASAPKAPPEPAKASPRRPSADAETPSEVIDTFHQLRGINAACLEVLSAARSQEKPLVLLRAVDRITRQIELQGKLLSKIQKAETVDIAALPEWHDTRQAVLDALRPFPEARDAVIEALREAGS